MPDATFAMIVPIGAGQTPVDFSAANAAAAKQSAPWSPRTAMIWPPTSTDVDWGVTQGQLGLPGYIDLSRDTLPKISAAPEQPPADPGLGAIWPPLPPDAPKGKCALLVTIPGVGKRYVVVDIPASIMGAMPAPPPMPPMQPPPPAPGPVIAPDPPPPPPAPDAPQV
jgi:hypothetical protein